MSGTFKAPINGLYHFDAFLTLKSEALNSFFQADISLMVKRGITVTTVAFNLGSLAVADFELKVYDNANLAISTDVQLQANDLVYLVIDQSAGGLAEILQGNIYTTPQFSGHLIFEN